MKKKDKKANNILKKIFIFLLLFGIAVLLYSHFLGTKGLFIREYAITNKKIPDSFHGVKIVHFTDLHYGTTVMEKELTRLVDTINELKPDIVVFTGDLIDQDYKPTQEDEATLMNELARIDANLDKYYVRGNHDKQDSFNEILNNANFINLNNSNALIYNKDNNPILLVGLDDYLEHTVNIESAFNYEQNDYYTILLTHEPDIIDRLNDYSIDLILAGHSHNGQVRIPPFGAVITPVGCKKYYDSEYTLGDAKMYISGGIGTSSAPFRLFVRPSINLYRIYNN